jgi:cytochrome c peroxidase
MGLSRINIIYLLLISLVVFIGCLSKKKMPSSFGKNPVFENETDKFNWNESDIYHDVVQINFEKDNPPNKYLFEIGARLLRDNILSHNQSFSCITCHQPQHNFADTVQFSLIPGSNKKTLNFNTPSLTNLGYHKYFGILGEETKMEDFIKKHIADKLYMNLKEKELAKRLNSNEDYVFLLQQSMVSDSFDIKIVSKSLSQYIRSLSAIFSNIEIEIREKGLLDKSDSEIIAYFGNKYSQGVLKAFFLCDKCHSYLSWGGEMVTHNGLKGVGYKVRVPGLKNIKYTYPYMHDGRYASLEDVIRFYNSGIQEHELLDSLLRDEKGKPIKLGLTDKEINQLVEFLHELTDEEYMNHFRNQSF